MNKGIITLPADRSEPICNRVIPLPTAAYHCTNFAKTIFVDQFSLTIVLLALSDHQYEIIYDTVLKGF